MQPSTNRWLRLAGAVVGLALALATPPAAQSQAQSAPPCSDVPPTLKRGTQPAPPPCPDPPPAASRSADSVPTRSLTPSESLIERARGAAFQFSQKLPNFICQEFMSRFTQRGREEKMPLDLVSAEIIYEDGQESYRNVKINNRPCRRLMGPGPLENLRPYCWNFFTPIHTRISAPAVRLLFRVSVPRFTTFKCRVKIHTGCCTPALRVWLRLT
jgi:hypothetical protein